ncbi:MAG TPA: SpoIID/LytB domain-containing protein [Thermosynechococcaceae cyanobacterium]
MPSWFKSLRFKSLQQRPWLLLPVLAAIPIAALTLARPTPDPKPAIAIAPASPAPLPPAAIPPSPAPSPALKPALPKPTPVPATVDGKPVLTQEQEELNRKGKAAFQAATAPVDSVIEMHVAIAEGVPALTIGSTAGADLLDQKGNRLGELGADTPSTAQADGTGITLGGLQLPSIVSVEPRNSGFTLGNRVYRGRLMLVASQGRLWAVNYVDMASYLYSVVGSEVSPSWPIESLKAQAIAARSYALAHYFRPASSFYHLGATEQYQVYSGIEREAGPMRQAVNATSGQFVSYKGGVVESLYAASDAIVAEAFQGRGMSQLGALALAQKGASYTEILGHYYPGTGVTRIVLDHE